MERDWVARLDEELKEILEKQLEVLKELEKITTEKTELIMNENIDKLQKMTIKEEDLINKTAILEVKRGNLLDIWGVKKDTPLSTLIVNIPEGKEELDKLGRELLDILENIKQKNDLNNVLIQDSLDWIEFNLNLVTNTHSPITYGKENKKSDLNNSLFDRKV